MKNAGYKAVAIFLSLLIAMSLSPAASFAEENSYIDAGENSYVDSEEFSLEEFPSDEFMAEEEIPAEEFMAEEEFLAEEGFAMDDEDDASQINPENIPAALLLSVQSALHRYKMFPDSYP